LVPKQVRTLFMTCTDQFTDIETDAQRSRTLPSAALRVARTAT
jgi:hypothetical protein